jgi:AraC-like DNA-binding protein
MEYGLSVQTTGERESMRGRFRDIEELTAAVAKWDLDFVQLDAGSAPTDLTQTRAPGLLIQRFRFGAACLQRGTSPLGMRTYGLRESEARGARMFGSDLSGTDLTQFQAGGDFEGVSQSGFACLSVSIDETLFEEALEAVNLYRVDGPSETGPRVLSVAPKLVGRVRCRAKQLLEVLEANPRALARSVFVEDQAFELAIDLAQSMQSAAGVRRRSSSRTRDLALRRAVSLIEDHLDEAVTIRELCKEAGVGWTTLVQAFREHFGVTPKAYVRVIRLNRSRRDLLKGAPEALVADVANRWGFWHMGQFAKDYGRLFGELPSDTRNRMLVPRLGASSHQGVSERPILASACPGGRSREE